MKLLKRSCRVPSVQGLCHILAAPTEIRLGIYNHIAEQAFLPRVHHRDYFGLFLSCKKIRHEMEGESLRLAPSVLGRFQEHDPDPLVTIRPLCPAGFSSLMHVTIALPRWAFFSQDSQEGIFVSLTPILLLHLSSLTIGIEDLETPFHIYQLVNSLSAVELRHYQEASEGLPVCSGGTVEKAKFYDVRTTYTDIVKFATAINCLVAPQLCDGQHDEENYWCIRWQFRSVASNYTCNVRRIVLSLKKLHDEVSCYPDGLPDDVYPHKSIRLRWCPTDEASQLRKYGWRNLWTNMYGVRKILSKQDPAQFVWYKLPDKRSGRENKATKRLLEV